VNSSDDATRRLTSIIALQTAALSTIARPEAGALSPSRRRRRPPA